MPKGNIIKTNLNYRYYMLLFLVMATLVLGIFALINTYQLKKAIIPNTVNINDFLKRLASHQEMKSYVGIAPLNIIQIDENNLANLQAQISNIDTSYIGDYIVQYNDRIVVYDYDNDAVRGAVSLQQQAQLPADFFVKLNRHSELKGLEAEQPIGGQLDESSLATLKQQFPDVYANAKVGHFLLRYQTKLVIYDYNKDIIINSVRLG